VNEGSGARTSNGTSGDDQDDDDDDDDIVDDHDTPESEG
jgi:hypothetical protein